MVKLYADTPMANHLLIEEFEGINSTTLLDSVIASIDYSYSPSLALGLSLTIDLLWNPRYANQSLRNEVLNLLGEISPTSFRSEDSNLPDITDKIKSLLTAFCIEHFYFTHHTAIDTLFSTNILKFVATYNLIIKEIDSLYSSHDNTNNKNKIATAFLNAILPEEFEQASSECKYHYLVAFTFLHIYHYSIFDKGLVAAVHSDDINKTAERHAVINKQNISLLTGGLRMSIYLIEPYKIPTNEDIYACTYSLSQLLYLLRMIEPNSKLIYPYANMFKKPDLEENEFVYTQYLHNSPIPLLGSNINESFSFLFTCAPLWLYFMRCIKYPELVHYFNEDIFYGIHCGEFVQKRYDNIDPELKTKLLMHAVNAVEELLEETDKLSNNSDLPNKTQELNRIVIEIHKKLDEVLQKEYPDIVNQNQDYLFALLNIVSTYSLSSYDKKEIKLPNYIIGSAK
ncbi:MAG: hypothetical protein KatS3mg083_135 [Candidatus Dojkabacteria bacterium]|nr:MAG: hypothetical protein KatS3mg083_135 [Candidatus Dojkabacteria bacterium]